MSRLEEEGSHYRFLLEEEALYYDPRIRRKFEVRKKKKYPQDQQYYQQQQQQQFAESVSRGGILKRHALSPDPPLKPRKASPLSSDEERLLSTGSKFDTVRKPWSSLKDQTKQSVISIPRRSRSLTEARQLDKQPSSLPFKTRVTSALKAKPSSTPSPTSPTSSVPESPSLMSTLTTSIRNKAQRLQAVAPPQSLQFLSPLPRIEVTSEEEDPQKSILKSTSPVTALNDNLGDSLQRVVTFSIPPGKRRTSLCSISSSTPDLRSTASESNNVSSSRQSSFDSDDPEQQDDKTECIVSELLRQSPKEKSDIYYWINEREKLMKEVEKCFLKLRGVSRIIEEQLLQNTKPTSLELSNTKEPPRVMPDLSKWQIGFLSTPKSYSFPYLCESSLKVPLRSRSWPRLESSLEEDSSLPLFESFDDPEDAVDLDWEISMNRLSIARETSILSEDEMLERGTNLLS